MRGYSTCAGAALQTHCDAGARRRLHFRGSQLLLVNEKRILRATVRRFDV
jgi:hypothetical protein